MNEVITENGKHFRVLFAGDLHKRMKDKATISGYVEVCNQMEVDVMNKCKELEVTHFISLGDWFDGGYGSDVAAALAHTDIDTEFMHLMKGNFYGLIGNHIRINMDSNPELFLIQPHNVYTSRHKVNRNYQILKTPDELILNNVQISFKHFSTVATSAFDYRSRRREGINYHIGLYHSEAIIPSSYLHAIGMTMQVNDNSMIANALDGVDLAIVGHIHKPLGTFKIEKANGAPTTMIVPGSLTNTDAGLLSRHNSVKLPLIDISEDSVVTLSYVDMDLHTNKLTFMKKDVGEESKKKLKSLRGNNKETLYEDAEASAYIGDDSVSFLSLNSFLKSQRYTQGDKDLIRHCIHSPEDIDKLIEIYMKDTVMEE